MEELEDPIESLKETIEAAEEKREEKEKWTLYVALSTAIIAVVAAIAGMLGNHHSNEAVLEQITASNQWSYYQSKSIKAELAGSTAQVLTALGKPLPEDNTKKMARYDEEKKQIKETAETIEKSAEMHLRKHIVFSRAVTIFQIAIAISATAVLTRRKFLWYISMALSLAGAVFLALGFLTN